MILSQTVFVDEDKEMEIIEILAGFSLLNIAQVLDMNERNGE